jgi:hypothetical protein
VATTYVVSATGLVHACRKPGLAVCGARVRASWDAVEVREWRIEPNACHSCDDVVMMRGRKAAGERDALAVCGPAMRDTSE